MTHALDALVFLAVTFVLAWIGKVVFGVFHPAARVDREVTARDNVAFALPLGAYYFGILIVIGAPLAAPSRGPLWRDAAAVALWGVLAILLLNIASVVSDRLLFGPLDFGAEILDRGNVAAGIVLAGAHVANAMLIVGALTGEGGVLAAAVFWVYAKVLLEIATVVFLRGVRHDVAREIVQDNRAAALVVAGVLIAMANVLRMAIAGAFDGWIAGLVAATGYAAMGLVLLFVVHWLTDTVLLPGVTLRQEVLLHEVPNVGVGFLEAVFFVGTSLLIGAAL